MKKEISELTEKEILRQQLELLAEKSNHCADGQLAEVTDSMIKLYSVLSFKDPNFL